MSWQKVILHKDKIYYFKYRDNKVYLQEVTTLLIIQYKLTLNLHLLYMNILNYPIDIYVYINMHM